MNAHKVTVDELEYLMYNTSVIDAVQFRAARDESARTGESFWLSLARLGFPPDRISSFLAEHSGVPFIRLGSYRLSAEAVKLLPRDFCFHYCSIPLFLVRHSLSVAFSNPLDTALVDTVAKMTHYGIEPLAASRNAILSALHRYWDVDEKDFEMAQFAHKPQHIKGFIAGRRAGRVSLSVPVTVTVKEGEGCVVIEPMEGVTQDISCDGEAVGLKIPCFLPRGLAVIVALEIPERGTIVSSGNVEQSRMAGEGEYAVGVSLKHQDSSARACLKDFISSRDAKKNNP